MILALTTDLRQKDQPFMNRDRSVSVSIWLLVIFCTLLKIGSLPLPEFPPCLGFVVGYPGGKALPCLILPPLHPAQVTAVAFMQRP